MPFTVVVAIPDPSQLKSPPSTCSLIVVLPLIISSDVEVGMANADASGIVTTPPSSSDELPFKVIVLAVPEKVMELLITEAPVTDQVLLAIDVMAPAPLSVA